MGSIPISSTKFPQVLGSPVAIRHVVFELVAKLVATNFTLPTGSGVNANGAETPALDRVSSRRPVETRVPPGFVRRRCDDRIVDIA